jgi:hypothetical protein
LSRSKIIIASANSSFSSWASYLGECPKIITPSRTSLYETIFTKDMKDKIFEGGYDLKYMDMPMAISFSGRTGNGNMPSHCLTSQKTNDLTPRTETIDQAPKAIKRA